MKILVTGGAGMIGSHAAEMWVARGHTVTVLDNLTRSRLCGSDRESVECNWRFLSRLPGVRLVKGDVRKTRDVREALGDGVDVVLHAAAQTGIGFSLRDPEEDLTINVLGTLRVLEEVRRRCPHAIVLYCSTNKVYGDNANARSVSETPQRYVCSNGARGIAESTSLDLAGRTPYGVSKCAADLYVQDYACSYGIRTAVFRLSCIYGTRQFGFEDQGWVAHFAISTLLGRPIAIYGDGKQVRDVLYVDDLIHAFDRFIESALSQGVFNIGGGPTQTVSLLELLALLEQLTGKRSPIIYRDWRPHDQKVYVSDVVHIQKVLGWQPSISLEEGLPQLVQWVEQHRELL